LVETDGFEPPRFLGARFTVSCNQPLCHVSKTYHIETHWLLLVIVFNYLSVAVDQCVFIWYTIRESNSSFRLERAAS